MKFRFAIAALATVSVGWASSISGASGTIQGAVASGGTTASLFSAGGGASGPLSNGHFSNSSQLQGVAIYDVA